MAAKSARERNDRHEVDSGRREKPDLLLPGEQRRRRLARRQNGEGMRLEGHQHRRQTEGAGAGHDTVENRALPAVNAVVVADGDHRRTRQSAGTERVGDDLHRAQATEAAISTPGVSTGPTIRPTRSLAKASVISTRAKVPAGAAPSLINRRPSISGAMP